MACYGTTEVYVNARKIWFVLNNTVHTDNLTLLAQGPMKKIQNVDRSKEKQNYGILNVIFT